VSGVELLSPDPGGREWSCFPPTQGEGRMGATSIRPMGATSIRLRLLFWAKALVEPVRRRPTQACKAQALVELSERRPTQACKAKALVKLSERRLLSSSLGSNWIA